MKLVLDVKLDKEPNENDIIICKNGKWVVVSRESFVAKYVNEQRQLNMRYEEDIAKLQRDLVELAKIVKEK